MPRVPPHAGLQDESERRIEAGLHPHEAQEVVHHVVGVIDVDPPGGRDRPRGAVFGSGRPRRDHEILAAHVQREAEIRTTREPGSPAHARPGLARERAPDVAAREHVVLYPRDEIHRILRIARAHCEQADLVATNASGESRTSGERHGVAERIEPDPPAVEHRGMVDQPVLENATRLEEEVTLFGEKQRKPGQIDHLVVRFDLREISVSREVEREGWGGSELGIQAGLESGRAEGEQAVVAVGRILQGPSLSRDGAVGSQLGNRATR